MGLSIRSKLPTLAVFATIALTPMPAGAQGSTSPPDPNRPALFAGLGITRGQTVRLHVTNVGLATPPDPENPVPALPPPCRALLAFVDGDGNVIRNAAGEPVRRAEILQKGQTASLQINGDAFVPRDQLRLSVRPVVVVASIDSLIPPPCTPVVEVTDNLFGRTSFVYAGTPSFTTPPEPETPVLFGVVGLGHLQTARINVSNVGLASPPEPDDTVTPLLAPPCRASMTFVDTDGNVLRNSAGQPIAREVMLEAGHSASLQINSEAFLTRDQLRVGVRPVAIVAAADGVSVPPPCVPALEVIDNLTGRTSWVYGGAPSTKP
jgi:hypothetical protein